MLFFKVAYHPLDKVVFEYTLDELVKEVWGDKFVDIGMGEIFGERLEGW